MPFPGIKAGSELEQKIDRCMTQVQQKNPKFSKSQSIAICRATIKRGKAANYSARAGQNITQNLRRGNDGEFESTGQSTTAVSGLSQMQLDALKLLSSGKSVQKGLLIGLTALGLVDKSGELTTSGKTAVSHIESGDLSKIKGLLKKSGDGKPSKGKKPKKGGGGRGKKKPTRAELRKQNLEKILPKLEKLGVSKSDIDSLLSFSGGDPLPPDKAKPLALKGLVDLVDNKPTSNKFTKMLISGINKGDARQVTDAVRQAQRAYQQRIAREAAKRETTKRSRGPAETKVMFAKMGASGKLKKKGPLGLRTGSEIPPEGQQKTPKKEETRTQAQIDREINEMLDGMKTSGFNVNDIRREGRAPRGQGKDWQARNWAADRIGRMENRRTRLERDIASGRGTSRDRREITRKKWALKTINETLQVTTHVIQNLVETGSSFADAKGLLKDLLDMPAAMMQGIKETYKGLPSELTKKVRRFITLRNRRFKIQLRTITEKAKIDAITYAKYRPAGPATSQVCQACKFRRGDTKLCTLYDFAFKDGYVCDSWLPNVTAVRRLSKKLREETQEATGNPSSITAHGPGGLYSKPMGKKKKEVFLEMLKRSRGPAETRAMFAKMGASGKLRAKGPDGKRSGGNEPLTINSKTVIDATRNRYIERARSFNRDTGQAAQAFDIHMKKVDEFNEMDDPPISRGDRYPSHSYASRFSGITGMPTLLNTTRGLMQSGIVGIDGMPKKKNKEHTPPTLTVFKDTNGQPRWLSVSSSSYRDRDGEIVSLKAIKTAVATNDTNGDHGPLRWWHVKGVELGTTDTSIVLGKMLVESGTFESNHIAQRVKENLDQLGMSIGFKHPITEPDNNGIFHNINIFERSLLPKKRASNHFTKLTVKGDYNNMASQQEKLAQLASLLDDSDVLTGFLASVKQTDEEAEAAGVAWKETTAENPTIDELMQVWNAYKEAEAELLEEEYQEETVKAEEMPPKAEKADGNANRPLTRDEFNAGINRIAAMISGMGKSEKEVEEIEAINARLAELETQKEALQTQLDELNGTQPRAHRGYRASEQSEPVKNPHGIDERTKEMSEAAKGMGHGTEMLPVAAQFADLFGNANGIF